uniref:Uncharacterized protein n=1 Tax=Aegilops tauschii subsp. strangulata TaxID=200361 RepID=A0A453G739_AEGTS
VASQSLDLAPLCLRRRLTRGSSVAETLRRVSPLEPATAELSSRQLHDGQPGATDIHDVRIVSP